MSRIGSSDRKISRFAGELAREAMMDVVMVCFIGAHKQHDIAQRGVYQHLPIMNSDPKANTLGELPSPISLRYKVSDWARRIHVC